MKRKQRTPEQNVNKVMREKRLIPAENLHEAARVIVIDFGFGGSIVVTESCLAKKVRGGRLVKFRDKDGIAKYGPKSTHNTRAGAPRGTRRAGFTVESRSKMTPKAVKA